MNKELRSEILELTGLKLGLFRVAKTIDDKRQPVKDYLHRACDDIEMALSALYEQAGRESLY